MAESKMSPCFVAPAELIYKGRVSYFEVVKLQKGIFPFFHSETVLLYGEVRLPFSLTYTAKVRRRLQRQ